jgi:hypothetical protein
MFIEPAVTAVIPNAVPLSKTESRPATYGRGANAAGVGDAAFKDIGLNEVTAVDVAVSVTFMINLCDATPVGNDFATAVTESESTLVPRASALIEIVPAVVESDLLKLAVPAVVVMVTFEPATPENAACEGTELSTPIPNAATATSAMRLKFVFEDICFLSLVVTRNFLVAASR